jgi:hypothetical protein
VGRERAATSYANLLYAAKLIPSARAPLYIIADAVGQIAAPNHINAGGSLGWPPLFVGDGALIDQQRSTVRHALSITRAEQSLIQRVVCQDADGSQNNWATYGNMRLALPA